MRRFHAAAPAALALALGCTVPAPGGPPPPPAPVPDAATQVAELVNLHRERVGCPALRWDARAARAAQAHAEDMRRRGYFRHNSPEGADVGNRLRARGIAYRMAAENLALDTRTADRVVRGWLDSPGHRRNVEECGLTHHGVGVSGDRWVHVLFTPMPG